MTFWRRLRGVPDAVWIVLAWLPVAALQIAPWSRTNGLDDIAYNAPNQRVTLDAWFSLRAPLWNEFVFGGSAHLGNLQTAALYPGNLVAAPFPDLLGHDIEAVLHVLLLGFGWWWLGRRLAFARPAPLAMALIAMWCGATITRSGALVHLPPLAWAPVAMACVHMVVTDARPWKGVGLSALAAWCLFASGHPQSVLMAGTLVAAWAVGLVVQHRAPRRLLHLAAASGLTMAMAAPLLFALRQATAAQYGSGRSVDALQTPGWFLLRRQTATTLFGQPLAVLRATYANGEAVAYVGAVVAALAVLGLVTAIRTRAIATWFVVVAGGFAFAISFGAQSPVLRAARRWVPGFDQPRVSVRWLWVVAMVAVLLAGHAVDALRRERVVRRDVVWLAGAVAVVALVLIVGVEGGRIRSVLLWLVAAGAVAAAWWCVGRRRSVAMTAVVMIAAVELLWPLATLSREREGDSATSSSELIGEAAARVGDGQGLVLAIVDERYEDDYVVGGMRPNAGVLADARSVDGYDGGVWVTTRWVAALHQFVPVTNSLTFRAQLFGPLEPERMARLGVRAVLYDPRRGPAAAVLPGWVKVPVDDEFEVWENPAWRGDVTVWYGADLVADPLAAGDRIRVDFAGVVETAMVEDPAAVLICDDDCAPDSAVSTSPRAGERRAEITASSDAVVMFAEQFDEGWTATVDGDSVEVIAVDGAWVGVRVAPGEHTIELRYRPDWWVPSIAVAVAALIGTLWLALSPVVRPRLARPRDRSSPAQPAS